jgi:hypothetical protein
LWCGSIKFQPQPNDTTQQPPNDELTLIIQNTVGVTDLSYIDNPTKYELLEKLSEARDINTAPDTQQPVQYLLVRIQLEWLRENSEIRVDPLLICQTNCNDWFALFALSLEHEWLMLADPKKPNDRKTPLTPVETEFVDYGLYNYIKGGNYDRQLVEYTTKNGIRKSHLEGKRSWPHNPPPVGRLWPNLALRKAQTVN